MSYQTELLLGTQTSPVPEQLNLTSLAWKPQEISMQDKILCSNSL